MLTPEQGRVVASRKLVQFNRRFRIQAVVAIGSVYDDYSRMTVNESALPWLPPELKRRCPFVAQH